MRYNKMGANDAPFILWKIKAKSSPLERDKTARREPFASARQRIDDINKHDFRKRGDVF